MSKDGTSDITRNPSHFVHAILPDCGVPKVQQSMPDGIKLRKKYGKIGSEQRRNERFPIMLCD